MNLIIHRGTEEIGGTCIELQSGEHRILLDFGMPLVNSSGGAFDFSKFKHLTTKELITKGVLPDVIGAYDRSSNIGGVIITHPHADHYGLMGYLSKDIPVWMGKATHKIFELNNIFLNQHNVIHHPEYFEKGKSFKIGPFTLTPYWNDHSAFDTYAFLIEAEGKRIFYSADFRSHGRKKKAYQWFLKNAPKDIDYLLIEGTTIGRAVQKTKTEDDLEQDFTTLFKKASSLTCIYTSSQNIDRLVSIYRACLKSGKTMVADVYSANVLHTISEFAGVPSPLKGYSHLKVLFPQRLTTSLFKRKHGDMANRFAGMKITKGEITKDPGAYVMLVRPSMLKDIEKIGPTNGEFIYSMWSGYKKQQSTLDFLDWFTTKGFTIHNIHTSGHADVATLKEYADTINPKVIIPIHTFMKREYKTLFTQVVKELNDGEYLSMY